MAVDIEGFGKGELAVMTAGRGVGKSNIVNFMKEYYAIFGEPVPAFKRLSGAMVDGEQWYTVHCNKDVAKWVRTMEQHKWQEHIDQRGYINMSTFDMHEKLYTMLAIKFS